MRADRLLSIMLLLQTRGKLTAQVLAEELEVSERTIYRDMDALSAAGVPVYCERGPGGGCALLDSYRTNLTGLTRDEVRALFMLSIPAPLQALGVDQDLRAALHKLSAALPEIMRPEGSRAQARIHLDSTASYSTDRFNPHLAGIHHALWHDLCINLSYQLAFDARVTHQVAPYGLVAKANEWYLVCARQDSLHVVPVSKILAAEIIDQTFTLPAGFDLVEFWTDWNRQREQSRPHFQVQVRVAPNLIETWKFLKDPLLPAHQSLEMDANGWYPLTLHFDTFENARQRLLNFGGALEIISPHALRESVMDFAQQVISVYKS
jgi:predicted DNA-binding transcriptional regulator YafY